MATAPWDEVLRFWFGDSPDDATVLEQKGPMWWSGGAALDAEIRERFGALRQAAIEGELQDWTRSADGRLALILLVDQFSRHIFRGDRRAFQADALARRWARDGIRAGMDARVPPARRVFWYLPFEHSEVLADQQEGVRLSEALAAQVPEALRKSFESFADFARRHRDIVERFGRFPHRNAALGRASTAEELEFLRQPGSSF